MLQFITNASTPEAVVNQVKLVLAGGCKWIQLRMKNSSPEEVTHVAKTLQPLCKEHEAILVVDDHVEIAKELALDGVHLGKNDMPVADARRLVGEDSITLIGATANTLNDIIAASPTFVDYIGLGPFRFTTTKANLSPVLGLEGYKDIVAKYRERGGELPIVAIGGIEFDDIHSLMATGVSGIAVSGAIANAADVTAETQRFIEQLEKYKI